MDKLYALWFIKECVRNEYKKILKHRNECPKWKKQELCLECFGGGLTKFWEAVISEIEKEWKP